MLRRWIEFILLFVVLPAALLAVKRLGVSFPVLPVLWVAACAAARFLAARHGWGAKEFLGFSLTRRQAGHLALRLIVAVAALALPGAATDWLTPSKWQSFFLNEMGDMDKSPEEIAEDVFRLIADMGHSLPGTLRLVHDVDNKEPA